jgi:chromosome segregation ATPase
MSEAPDSGPSAAKGEGPASGNGKPIELRPAPQAVVVAGAFERPLTAIPKDSDLPHRKSAPPKTRAEPRKRELSADAKLALELEARLHEARGEAARLDGRLTEAVQEADRLRTDLANLRSHSLGEFHRLEGVVAGAELAARQDQAHLRERAQQIATCEAQIAGLEGQIAAFKDQLPIIWESLKDFEATRAMLSTQVTALSGENGALNSQLAGLVNDIGRVEGELAASRQECAEAQAQLPGLTEQIAALQAAGDAAESRFATEETLHVAASERLEQSLAELAQLRAEVLAARLSRKCDEESLRALAAYACHGLDGMSPENGVLSFCIAVEQAIDRLRSDNEAAQEALKIERAARQGSGLRRYLGRILGRRSR